MGGNVFPSRSRRYSKDEYVLLEKEVTSKLLTSIFVDNNLDVSKQLQPLKYYRTKESFGDMDIVTNSSIFKTNWIPELVKEFGLGHNDWFKNGNVFSFLYKDFQIDLIGTQEHIYQTSLDYFAWNDLGNLCGRIFHKHGIKFGHTGSHIIVRDSDNKLGEILITQNTREIMELLEFDYDKWEAGFDSLDEIYTWVSSTKYFNKDIYALENRNHYARTRDKKRANYAGFLEWVEGKDLPQYPYDEVTSRDGYDIREPFFTDLICKKFAHVKVEYDKLLLKHEERKVFKTMFNGNIVMDITKLVGKELGNFMEYCREVFDENPELKDAYIRGNETIHTRVINSLLWHYNTDLTFGDFTMEEYNDKHRQSSTTH